MYRLDTPAMGWDADVSYRVDVYVGSAHATKDAWAMFAISK